MRRKILQALLQEHTFVIGLAVMLDTYDLSKITPEMDEPVESMLIDISIFYWMATLDTEDDVSEVDEKLLKEAFGLTLRSLLRQSPTTQRFIFILKHLDTGGSFFLPALNQLLYCGKHHPRIDLDEVQQVFPGVPREIWQTGKTYENINEDHWKTRTPYC
ncbi:gap junction alpha-4 protein isoform X3 [Ahaetulla prasina]|uniref:gap junction alpha-4 protein isoform X3 n=1 Tax=Ahaetulla prasina TaxID=499056 RepID=UPI00264A1997|nr:gap junction alpha-4 protein isoform X3 [Ahaetulla prasina]